LKIVWSIVLLGLASACSHAASHPLDLMFGHLSTEVLVTSETAMLSAKPLTFTSTRPLYMVGRDAAVCLVLMGERALASKAQMKAFERALKGRRVSAELTLANGKRVSLSRPGMGWSLEGKVFPEGELYACMVVPHCGKLPAGTRIESISLSSSPNLQIAGILWESDNLNDDTETAPPVAVASAQSNTNHSCVK
jgi:hypothetical protein